MNRLSAIDWTAIVVVVIGGINWLLVGLFKFNLVQSIFGNMTIITRLIYIIVGISAFYLILNAPKFKKP